MNFLIKKFSLIILSISFLIFIYTFYRSEIFWDGNNRSYYKIYYMISLILIFSSLITFFISNKIKQYLIIIFASLIVSLYIFQGYLILSPILKEQLYKNQTGKKWDKRERFEIYNDLKKIKNKITVKFYPYIFLDESASNLLLPLSGLSNSQTIYCNENGYYSIYQSDRYGFNNPNTEWNEKEIEYLLVGDSYTHGACVNRPNDIASVLRSLSNKSVLNLGMGGNGPLIEYATLREYLGKNVKKVLWIYSETNDLDELANEMSNSILINYFENLNFTQNLKFKQNEADDLIRNHIEKEKNKESKLKNTSESNLIKFIKFYDLRFLLNAQKLRLYKSTKKSNPHSIEEFKKILQLTKELVEKNNSKLYFVYLPGYSRYKINDNYNDKNYNLVKNIVSELKIPFIDVHKKVFKSEQNVFALFPFGSKGHYNVEGYQKVAEFIYKFTKDK